MLCRYASLSYLLVVALGTSSINPLPTAYAQVIYQWTDEQGAVHYSTTQKGKGATPSNLPELTREDINRRIHLLQSQTPKTCFHHGGIDCARGPDIDGSVICLDGFTDAILPFPLHCGETRLEAIEFALRIVPSVIQSSMRTAPSILQEEVPSGRPNDMLPVFGLGKHAPISRRLLYERFPLGVVPGNASSVRLVLRNTSGVEARGMKVHILLPTRKLVLAEGPDRIEPFALGDYEVALGETGPLGSLGRALRVEDIVTISFEAKCDNCAGFVGTRQMPVRQRATRSSEVGGER